MLQKPGDRYHTFILHIATTQHMSIETVMVHQSSVCSSHKFGRTAAWWSTKKQERFA